MKVESIYRLMLPVASMPHFILVIGHEVFSLTAVECFYSHLHTFNALNCLFFMKSSNDFVQLVTRAHNKHTFPFLYS